MKLKWQKEYELFQRGGKFYNYAPSWIQLSNHECYLFYCSNKYESIIRDHIMFRKGTLERGKWRFGEEKLALRPNKHGWDSVHVCDPAILGGKFHVEDVVYRYVMFYLGASENRLVRNQIGVAYADAIEGPWMKWEGNPLIENKHVNKWGVGQACATSIDGEGLLLLYYTKQDTISTKIVRRNVDLSDLCNPIIGEEVEIPLRGLTNINGEEEHILNNGEIIYDSFHNQFILLRENHPNPRTPPSIISSHLQVAAIPAGAFHDASSRALVDWKVLGTIGPEQTRYARNHNPGLIKNKYGCLVHPNTIEAVFSVAEEKKFPNSLWTYRLHIVNGTLL